MLVEKSNNKTPALHPLQGAVRCKCSSSPLRGAPQNGNSLGFSWQRVGVAIKGESKIPRRREGGFARRDETRGYTKGANCGQHQGLCQVTVHCRSGCYRECDPRAQASRSPSHRRRRGQSSGQSDCDRARVSQARQLGHYLRSHVRRSRRGRTRTHRDQILCEGA